jgi:hypothetical protein
MSIKPETILDLAQAQGVVVTPARAQELAATINATLRIVAPLSPAFEAEPTSFVTALEEVAKP